MRWFKHFSDNHRGRSIQFLLDEMGHTGPCCYFFLVELCAEKLEQKPDKTLEDVDCLFEFHQRVVRQNLRISPANLRRLLDICQTFGLLSFDIRGETIQIKMPILLDLLDYDSKKSRARRATVVPESRLEKRRIEKNREEKKRVEEYKEDARTSSLPIEDFYNFWNSLEFLPKALKLTKERNSKIKARLLEAPIEDWKTAMLAIANHEFLLGVNDRGWKIDLDWFIKNGQNRISILEGKYTSKQIKKQSKADAMMDHFQKLHDEINSQRDIQHDL